MTNNINNTNARSSMLIVLAIMLLVPWQLWSGFEVSSEYLTDVSKSWSLSSSSSIVIINYNDTRTPTFLDQTKLTFDDTNNNKTNLPLHVPKTTSLSLDEESATTLPPWMKDYFAWHRQSLHQLEILARESHEHPFTIVGKILHRNFVFFQNNKINTIQKNTTTTITTAQQEQPSSLHPPLPPIQFLILRCNIQDKCGGFADRIKPLPVLIAAAAKSHRLFLIRWQRPAPLQEFLIPTQYLNWTVPTWLEDAIQQRRKRRRQFQDDGNTTNQNHSLTVDTFFGGTKLLRLLDPDHQETFVVEGKIQDSNGGENLYHELVLQEGQKTATELSLGINSPTHNPFFNFSTDTVARYQPIYHDLFYSLFRPSVPVANLVDHTLQSINLTPGQYVSAHFRAGLEVKRGPKFKKEPTYLIQAAIRAVNCSSRLLPGWPIYFASDSQVSLQAVQEYAKQNHRRIVTYEPPPVNNGTGQQQQHQQQLAPSPPNLHIEKTVDWDRRPPSDFYPTFVDFLVMGSGRCMAYGGGGFGKFAGMLSYNSSCILDHSHRDYICEWVG